LSRIFLEEYDILNPPVPSEVYGIFLATFNVQSLYSLPYEEEEEEEEEEDTFIYQCWAHEGHEYSHI
jgi:hypothetical protein